MKAPRGSSKLQVWLSTSETEEWTDTEFRVNLLSSLKERARVKGRRMLEVFDNNGKSIYWGVP